MSARDGERPRSAGVLGSMKRWLLLLGLAGCVGGVDNRPLRVGLVGGQLQGDGSSGALVFIKGRPDLQTVADADGQFVIGQVPVGTAVVVASAPFTAGMGQGTVGAGEASSLGVVRLVPAAGFVVEVRRRGVPQAGAAVEVVDAPLHALTDDAGRARLPALPPGPYRVAAQVDDASVFEDVDATGPGDSLADLNLDPALLPDGGLDPDAGADVDGGILLFPCTPCVDSAQCGPGGACIAPFDGGPTQCAMACLQDSDCGFAYGYSCTLGQCLPRSGEISSCDAPAAVGQACSATDSCRAAGLVLGVCEGVPGFGSCTVTCHAAADCPSGMGCGLEDGGHAGVCLH